jgi:hypothetical protein
MLIRASPAASDDRATSGIAYPDDLRLLKESYDDLCAENRIPLGCITAEDLAKATMNLFEIQESLREFLLRRSLPN